VRPPGREKGATKIYLVNLLTIRVSRRIVKVNQSHNVAAVYAVDPSVSFTFRDLVYIHLPQRIGITMTTARIERKIDRHILNLVDAIDVRTTDCGTWGFHRFPTSSTFAAMPLQPAVPYGDPSAYRSASCLRHHPQTTGHPMPGLGDRDNAERRAI
jgi:hypothetical protein